MRVRTSSLILLLASLFMAKACWADIFVVTSVETPLQAIGPKELQALYMGRRQALADGLRVQAADLPPGNPLRERFYSQLTGMSPAQISSHWARLLFSGQSTPPVMLNDEAALLKHLRRTPVVLGYSDEAPPPATGLKVVLVLKAPSDTAPGHAP